MCFAGETLARFEGAWGSDCHCFSWQSAYDFFLNGVLGSGEQIGLKFLQNYQVTVLNLECLGRVLVKVVCVRPYY